MRVESVLFLMLMVLKLITVVPMAFKNMGAGYAVLFCILTVASYGVLIYFSEKQRGTGGTANG